MKPMSINEFEKLTQYDRVSATLDGTDIVTRPLFPMTEDEAGLQVTRDHVAQSVAAGMMDAELGEAVAESLTDDEVRRLEAPYTPRTPTGFQ